MSTHLQGFRSFFRFLHHFVLAKLASSSIRVSSPLLTIKDLTGSPVKKRGSSATSNSVGTTALTLLLTQDT